MNSVDEWDDKITTLPGLYVLGAFYAKVVNLLLGTLDGCSLVKLRYFNVGVGLLEGFLLYMLRKKLVRWKKYRSIDGGSMKRIIVRQ